MAVFDRIRAITKMRGMTIKEVERRAGLHNGTIGKWRKSSPRLKNLLAVANVLGVKIETLLR